MTTRNNSSIDGGRTIGRVIDPLKFCAHYWPNVYFYRKQREIIYSVYDNDETTVTAGNMMGKDYVSAFIVLWFFLSRHPCRILTTSADAFQLESVLWGDISNFLETAEYPLLSERGGPIVRDHLRLRKIVEGSVCPLSYTLGRVAKKGEGMLGHHVADIGDGIPRTLFVADEASGVSDDNSERASTWHKRKLSIGNPYPCDNFFKRDIEGGDIAREGREGYHKKIVHISAEDSPNVQYARAEIAAGKDPSGRVILPGVLPWYDFDFRNRVWDEGKKTVSLFGRFFKDRTNMMFPDSWLDRGASLEVFLKGALRERTARAIGVDPAEGGDDTSLVAIDEWGVLDVISRKTTDTAEIPGMIIEFADKWKVPDYMIMVDRGGGGKQASDTLRRKGWNVRTVAFGEAPTGPVRRKKVTTYHERLENVEDRTTFVNRRAEMFGTLRFALDPGGDILDTIRERYGAGSLLGRVTGFCIPPKWGELVRQMSLIPLAYDAEGRFYVIPKNRKEKQSRNTGGQARTLIEILGKSPNELDALVVALHALVTKPLPRIGAIG